MAARREIILSKTELAPYARPLLAPHHWDVVRIILFPNFAVSNTNRAKPARGPPVSRFPPHPTPDPALQLAGGQGAVADWSSPAWSAGFKEGGGGALPSRSAIPAGCPSRRWACSLSWPPATSSVPHRAVTGRRLESAGEGQAPSNPDAGTARKGRGAGTPGWPRWWPHACR